MLHAQAKLIEEGCFVFSAEVLGEAGRRAPSFGVGHAGDVKSELVQDMDLPQV